MLLWRRCGFENLKDCQKPRETLLCLSMWSGGNYSDLLILFINGTSLTSSLGMHQNVRGHLFRWTDETMVEEMEDILPKIEKIEGSSLTLQKEVQSLECEMETLAIHTRTCESVVSGFEKELIRLENELQGCKMELREMKNLLVCVLF